MFRVVLLGFLIFSVSCVVVSQPVYAISLDDDEEDAEDVTDLLSQAKKAAKSESFEKANELLKKAKMYGIKKTDVKDASKYIAKKKKEHDDRIKRERKRKERLARLKREREREARLARQRAYSSSNSNYGLPKNMCYRTNGNYALYRYCNTGSCSGFITNYTLYNLCKDNDTNAFHGSKRMVNIRLYLEDGGHLSYDYFSGKVAYQSGKYNGSFRERKNFIIYLLNGMILVKY